MKRLINSRKFETSSSTLRVLSPMVREREVLRVAGFLVGDDSPLAIKVASTEVLRWAQSKAAAKFPAEAWSQASFEQLSSGRSRIAVRLETDGVDYWALRVEDPDKTVAGRIWTTEIVISSTENEAPKFTARLLVSSPEPTLQIEPHVPGLIGKLLNVLAWYRVRSKLLENP